MLSLISALPTGTEVHYYVVCPTKLWLFSHNIRMEQESEDVGMGRHIHETSYGREKKNVLIDGKIAIDFVKTGDEIVIHEVKKAKKLEESHRCQLRYYLWYLSEVKGIHVSGGILDYPLIKQREEVILTSEAKKEVENIIDGIGKVRALKSPPEPVRKGYCRRCAYFEFCWV